MSFPGGSSATLGGRSGALVLGALVVGMLHAGPVAAQARGGPATVDSLLGAGRLQEAAWAARALGDTARAETILARLEAILRSPPTSARPLGVDSQGVSYTWRLTHRDGVESLFKVNGSDIFCRECSTEREVAAYRIDRLLGIDLTPLTVPLTVTTPRDTMTGSAMYFMAQASSPAEAGVTKPDRMRFFDAVIGNSDRHRTNWLVLSDGRAVAIDHNRSFQYEPISRPKSCWETEIDSIARPAELGEPYRRYRTLPAESLAAAVQGLDPELIGLFIEMRDPVVERIERRAAEPRRRLPHDDCSF